MPYAREHIKPTKPSEYSNEESVDFYMDDFDELQSDDNGPELQSPAENSFYLPADDNSGTSPSVSGPGGKNRFAPYAQQDYGLTGFLRDEFNLKLSAFKEYHREGYNLKGLDRDALRQVRERLNKPSSIVTQSEWRGTMSLVWEYLQKIARIEEPSEMSPELQEALDQANKLTANMCTALDALDAVGTVGGKNWAEKVNEEASKQLDALTAEAIKRLNDNTALTLSDADYTKKKNELEGLLFSESYLLHAENYKFGKYKKSLLAEERFMRIRLAAYLDSTAEQILNGARESRKYALRYLQLQRQQRVPDPMKQVSPGRTDNRFRTIVDGGLTIPVLSEEPRMASFRPEKPVEPLPVRVSRAILPVTSALMEMAAALRQQGANLMPPEEESPEVYRDDVVAFFKEAPEKQLHRIKNMYHTARVAVSGLEKKVWETLPGLGYQPDVYSPVYKHTVNDAALLLLDELYQTERQLRLLPATAWELQESVEQYQSVTSQQPGRMFAEPVLNALLDVQLKQEAARWHGKIKQSEDKLTMLLAPVTRFARKTGSEAFWYDLWDELRKRNGGEGEWQGTAQFNDLMTGVVEKLSGIAREIEASALRLARHGHEGGKDLNMKIQQWLREVSLLKKRVKVGVTRITGKAPGYYSREGMLARGMAEWAEELKQDYLQETKPDDQEAAATVFEQNLIKIVKDNRQHFRTEDDPWARQLLQHLKLALKHAAQNTMTYPPTPEEILAGTRTVPDDIKRWAQKKVVSGAISAAIRQGFKVVSSPASLPGRLVLRSARTGIALYRGIKAINKGVKFGEGPATQSEAQFTRNQLFRAGFRLTMSLSPLAAWGASAAITVERLYSENKYGKKFVTETLNDLPEDLLWRGGYAGISRVFQTLFTQAIEQSDNRERQQLPNDGRSPAEAAETRSSRGLNPLINRDAGFTHYVRPDEQNDQSESEEDRGHRIRKRAVTKDSTGNKRPNFDSLINDRLYSELSGNEKKSTYFYALKDVLLQINNDERLPQNVRDNAYLARIGAPKLVPVDIFRHKLNNTFLIPDYDGAKSGLLVMIGAQQSYYYVEKGRDLGFEIGNNLPFIVYGSPGHNRTFAGQKNAVIGIEVLGKIRKGEMSFEKYFNYSSPEQMDIATLSNELTETNKENFKFKSQSINNKKLIQQAIAGSQIPDPGVSAEQTRYHLEFTWENLTPAEYLRSFSRPFATLSGQIQLVVSDASGDSIQKTEKNVERAQEIGTWVDVSVGAVTSFTPAGWILNTAQSAADIVADVSEGKNPDPLAVAGLIVGCIPGERIAAKIQKVSNIAGKSTKYVFMVGNKAIDLAIAGRSIKTAIDTGEPLAIYQALLASGMSSKNSYDMATSMSSRLKISKKMEGSASLEKQTAISNINIYKYNFSSQMHEADGAVRNKNSQKGEELSEARLSIPKTTLANSSALITGRTYADPIVYAGGAIGESRPITHDSSVNSPRDVNLPKFHGTWESSLDNPNRFSLTDAEIAEAKDSLLKDLLSTPAAKAQMDRITQYPAGQGDTAAKKVLELLQGRGYKTSIIGMLNYQSLGDVTPMDHYVVLATKNDKSLVIDSTFSQYLASHKREWVITSLEEWQKKLVSAEHLKNKLVIIKEYGSIQQAYNDIHLPDPKPWLQSKYSNDAQFKPIQIPGFMVRHMKAKFNSDIVLMNSKNGLERISRASSDINVEIKNLRKLRGKENSYIQKDKNVPDKIASDIQSTERKIAELKKIHVIPDRVNNFLLLTKHNPELRVAGVGLSSSAYDKLASSPLAERITYYRELSLQEHKSATPGNGYDASANQGQIEYPGPSTSSNLSFDKLTDHKIFINKPNRMILSRYFAGNRVESFDYKKSKFAKDDSFTLSRAEMASTSDVSVVRSEALKDSVADMENKTKTLFRHLKNYSGSDKQAVRDNLEIVSVALEEIKEDLNSPNAYDDSDDSIYVLTKKNADPNAVTNHFGLATFSYKHSSSNIKLNFLTAHPYVIVNKYPGFRNYLYRNNLIKTSDLPEYNIKNIARFLGIKAARREIQFMESIPQLRVETFSFHGANPITQKLGYQLERMSGLFSGYKPSETVVDDSVQIANTSRLQDEDKYLTEQIDYLRSTARNSFRPVEPIPTLSDAQTQSAVNKLLHTYNAKIMSHNVSESISSDDIEIKNFSAKVISSAEKAFDKVSVVKKLFDSAKSNPEIKNRLKSWIGEAVGLNDEVLVDIDKIDVSSISDLAYDRFKENTDKTYNYLAQKKADGFNNISLIKYRKLNSSSPQAFALPYDPKKRILVAIQSDNVSYDNLADTVVHEASHNAAYTLDHTYLGNVQAESGSFPDSFQLASRDTRYFSDNDLTITNSTNYALGLPANHRPTQEQQMHAQILLQNSRVIKADTLLNAAEYNAYMIHVFNRARINDSGTDIYFTESRRTRQISEVDDDFDRMIMHSLLKASGNYHSFDKLPDNDAGVESDIHLFASNPSQNVPSITMPARSADISVPESETAIKSSPRVHIPKTIHNPGRLGDYGHPGDIYSVRGDYWMIRCEGWPSESEWPMPSEGGTNDYWTYIGKHTGTREDPKVWTEYGFPGDLYRELGNLWKFKSEGRPSEQQLYYPTIEEPDDPYWQHIELIAGTWDNPKTWSDYGFPGDIYKEGNVYWKFNSRGFPQNRYWYYPAEETSDEHWTYLSKHSGTIDDPKTLSDYGYMGDIYNKEIYGYMMLKHEGRPSENGWDVPTNHKSNAHWDVVHDKAGTIESPRFWDEYGKAGDVYYDGKQYKYFVLQTEGNPGDENWYFPVYGDDTNEHWRTMWEGADGVLREEF